MTRIIGGAAGGRRLSTPRGSATRPTSDRVREALFSAVESWCGSFEGLRVLDLYAGSGALGLEALSRGADRAVLVEQDKRAARLVADNARTLGLPGAAVRSMSVSTFLGSAPEPIRAEERFDVVFSDPPYSATTERVERDLIALVEHGWLAPDALVVLERSSRSREPQWPPGLDALRSRRYGESVLWYGHAATPSTAEDH